MTESYNAYELSFEGVVHEEVFPQNGFIRTLMKFDKFLKMYSEETGEQTVPFPAKITRDRVVDNDHIRAWAAFKAPPLMLMFVAANLSPGRDVSIRVREILKACLHAAPEEYMDKPYGEILAQAIRFGGSLKHVVCDHQGKYRYITRFMVEADVISQDVRVTVKELEDERQQIRFDLNTMARSIVDADGYYNLEVLINSVEVPYGAVIQTRSQKWYTVNQDYYHKLPMSGRAADQSDLLSEITLLRVCKMMYSFAKQTGYGLRTYNKESSDKGSSPINIHELVSMMRTMPPGMDHPLAYAVNAFQAFSICLHVLHLYTSWRDHQTGQPLYRWTSDIVDGTDYTAYEFLQHHVGAVCATQSQNGLHLPEVFRGYAWNQCGVESGYVVDCAAKREAIDVWESEFQQMTVKPTALMPDDGLFPPNLLRHPPWVYETGRIAMPTASNLEPEGIVHPDHGRTPEQGRETSAEPRATPSHGAKRARTDEATGSASSSSAAPPPQHHQPEEEPSQPSWEEAPIPHGAQQSWYHYTNINDKGCRSSLMTAVRDCDEYPPTNDETPKFAVNHDVGTTSIQHYVRRLVTYLARMRSVLQSDEKGLNLQVYVKLNTKMWLRMYSRLYHALALVSCVHLPSPPMLTAAVMIEQGSDLVDGENISEESKITTMNELNGFRNNLGMGGKPDAVTMRSQPTILVQDFDILAKTRGTTHTLRENLIAHGWGEIYIVSPSLSMGAQYNYQNTKLTLESVEGTLNGLTEEQVATVTLHYHLSLQAILIENASFPFSDVGDGAQIRDRLQQQLKEVYVDPIIAAGKRTTRPPIVNINHDLRFVGTGSNYLSNKASVYSGFHALGLYIELELRARGCVVIHGSSFWSRVYSQLKQSSSGVYMLSSEKTPEPEPHTRYKLGYAIYEKQLFSEKMVSACFVESAKIRQWDRVVQVSTIAQPSLVEIWEDKSEVKTSTSVSQTWFTGEQKQRIWSEAQGDTVAESTTVTWQDFDIAMTFPEAYYDNRHYWFRIDTYATNNFGYVKGRTYYCPGCDGMKNAECYAQARFLPTGNGYPGHCIGCAHTSALKMQHGVSDFNELVNSQKYTFACAKHLYDLSLQFVDPRVDIKEFIKRCAQWTYEDVGKTVSHYGGLRITASQAIEYAAWGKAKQLAWDRGYDSEGRTCYICYYDAGNCAYAGFMRMLLTPDERRDCYRGTVAPKEELLGDTLELALGILTIAMRYPVHFPNWGGRDGANACVRGIERSFFRYASAEAIELITVDSPRKRTPPKKNAEMAEIVTNTSADLVIDFTVTVDGDVYPVDVGRESELQATDHVTDQEGVSIAPPMPPQEVEMDGQPEEELTAEEPSQRQMLREGLVAQLQEYVDLIMEGETQVGIHTFTFCVACGSDTHRLNECTENAATRDMVQRSLQIIKDGLLRYPRRQPAQQAEAMDVDTIDHVSVASSDRRPKAKARPRRGGEAMRNDIVLIRYENLHNLCTEVENRRGLHDACGVPLSDMGPENSQRVVDLVEELSDHRDRRLPQRGDRASYERDESTGAWANDGYESIGGGRPIRCGILDMIPTRGARFINSRWEHVDTVVIRNLNHHRRRLADWALSCIQSDLRHRIARRPGSEYLDGQCRVSFNRVIRCDEGGWVLIDELVRVEELWTHESRRITEGINNRDPDHRQRVYNERLQLLFQGNMLAATKRHKAKIRLQFLGVRVKEPSGGPLGPANSDRLVSVQDQIAEIQGDERCRRNLQYLSLYDGWVKPWAVRATSGHSTHREPSNNLLQLDKDRFAISPSMTLLGRLGGAFHATACRNLDSIVTQGVIPGSEDPDGDFDQRRRGRNDRGGRLHSYWGVFAPFDQRNATTKTRVHGPEAKHMPLAVLHVASNDLAREGGRVTDSGVIMVGRPVPFAFVKEVWFCVPDPRNTYSFALVEKIFDERLEREMVLDYHASPLLPEVDRYRTPAKLMELLCDMPHGPHDASKERIIRDLTTVLEAHRENTVRHHYMDKAIKFIIKNWRPEDLRRSDDSRRMRVCPACYNIVPACFSRCTSCWSTFISCGYYQGTSQRETPTEIPSERIAQTMEAAAAAVPEMTAEEQDAIERETLPEPEGVPEASVMGDDDAEQEPDAEMDTEPHADFDDDVPDAVAQERRPVLVAGHSLSIDPELQLARTAMQTPYYHDRPNARCIDANMAALSYMAYVVCRVIHKTWSGFSKWTTMPLFQLKENLSQGQRYDVLGKWGSLAEIDPETGISKEVSDEEIIRFAKEPENYKKYDPNGTYTLKRFRTNQLISTLVRGAIMMGVSRDDFNPTKYLKDESEVKAMHFCCLNVLCEVIPIVTGYSQFSVLRPTPTGPVEFLYIDPVGILLAHSDVSAQTIALLVDYNVQIPAHFADKLRNSRIEKQQRPNLRRPDALHHISASEYLPRGQTSIMDTPVTQEESSGAAASRAAAHAPRYDAGQHGGWNTNTYHDYIANKGRSKGRNQGKGRAPYPEDNRRNWEHNPEHTRQW